MAAGAITVEWAVSTVAVNGMVIVIEVRIVVKARLKLIQ